MGAVRGFDTIYTSARDTNDAAARLFEVRRQQNEHERAALASWRARRYGEAMREYITAGQVRIVDTHSNAFTLAAGIYRELAGDADALERAKKVTLISARNADAAVVRHLTRAQARADGQITGRDYRFNTPGGWIDLAAGELVLLKANQKIVDEHGQTSYLRNGRRAVIEAIDPAGDIRVRWNEPDGTQTSATISFLDVEEGMVRPGYVTQGNVLHGAGASTHSTQGGTVDRAVIIGSGIDNPNLAYTALSRDRHGVDLILDIESLAENPEEAEWLRRLPAERQRLEVVDRWLAQVTEHGPVDQRTLTERVTEPPAGAPAVAGQRRRWERPDWLEPDVELASEVNLAHLEYADHDLPFDPDYDRAPEPIDLDEVPVDQTHAQQSEMVDRAVLGEPAIDGTASTVWPLPIRSSKPWPPSRRRPATSSCATPAATLCGWTGSPRSSRSRSCGTRLRRPGPRSTTSTRLCWLAAVRTVRPPWPASARTWSWSTSSARSSSTGTGPPTCSTSPRPHWRPSAPTCTTSPSCATKPRTGAEPAGAGHPHRPSPAARRHPRPRA